MEKRHCPYLRIIDDPTSSIAYPHEVNACHRAKKPVKVILEYQESHCLCDAYQECPGYTKGWENGFPLELRADYDPASKNIFKRIQFWREEQQKKKSQKEEQKPKKEERDLKEALQSKLQIWKNRPEKVKEKPFLEEEPASKKAEVQKEPKLEPTFQPQEQMPEKTILQDEAALKEYLKEKRSKNNPLLRLFSKKNETTPEEKTKDIRQDDRASKEELKPKRDWKKTLQSLIPLSILPWIKKPQSKKVEAESPQAEREISKGTKHKKSLKEVFQNIIPWNKEKQPKQDRTKSIKERLSLQEEEQIIRADADSFEAEQPHLDEEQIVETSTQADQVKEPLLEEKEPEILPNEWVKEEEQFEEDKKEVLQEELPQREEETSTDHPSSQPEHVVEDREEYLPDVMSWRDKQKSKPEKKGLFKRKQDRKKEKPTKDRKRKAPEGVMAWRDKHTEKSGWRDAFKNKRVWLVSIGIILIFLLVIFIPQLPGLNLNLLDRFEGLFNPPISGTTPAITETPVSTPEGITQTEAMTSAATEVPSNTPSDTSTEQATPTTPATATITPTSVPTLTPTPGPPPFIFVTRTP